MATRRKQSVKPKGSSAADAVEAQLARYRKMRDFGVTPEPSGKSRTKVSASSLPFVVQKHAASHLHYDFRLGWNGVLKSWAVAKGPSLSVKDRRLAVEVEDHPIDYGGFEGTIPQGQYGGGTVMVWDQGTWQPQPGNEDVTKALREGSLKFELSGTKLRGKWALIHMKPRANERPDAKPNWLLIKEHDKFEAKPDAKPITERLPNSAVTGRTLDAIAAHADHVWNSNRPEKLAKSAKTPALKTAPAPKGARRESQPDFIAPELATEVEAAPEGAGWLHEIKLDGYRIQARKSGKDVRLLTRSGLDWTTRMRDIAAAISSLPATSVTLDGEACVLDDQGLSSFARLQAAFDKGSKDAITYFAFDLLHLNGRDTRELPLRERKQLLHDLLGEPQDHLQYSEHIEGGGDELFRKACEHHAEGILSKRADSVYRSSRTRDWLKVKCRLEKEFVIGGYSDSSEGPNRIGSLLLGYYDDGKLRYAGRTGTGFTAKVKRELHQQLVALATKATPFASATKAEPGRGVHWVKPKLVAQVAFATWTADNLVRQASYLGLREDKKPAEVTREGASDKPSDRKTKQPAKSKPAKLDIRLTHPDKILDTATGFTKRGLAEYYEAVADFMFPYVAGRPVSLVRCPEGAAKPCFFQRHITHLLPEGILPMMTRDEATGKDEPYISIADRRAIPGLAQFGVLEIHPWGCRNDDLKHPDRLIFDLDPDATVPWSALADGARAIRSRLRKLGLTSFLKTTGGKGLHVVVPIQKSLTWPQLKDAAYRIVGTLESESPDLYLTKMTKAARKGKIYLDYLRNQESATAVAPYSPRARAGMHVSLPLPWSALDSVELPVFPAKDFASWSSRLKRDPWKDFAKTRQKLDLKNLALIE